MKRVLVTGLPGTGKSAVIAELAARGFKAVDADDDGLSVAADSGEWVWHEERIEALLDADEAEVLFVGGCAANQVSYYGRFDHIVLLRAPADVLSDRLATRTSNPFGKTGSERARALDHLENVEPLLRKRATHEIVTTRPLAEVVDEIAKLVNSVVETDCIFCRIVAGDAPAFVVAEDERTVAFLDRNPATEGHTLVVPRSHAADIWAIDEADVCAAMSMVKRVVHLLDERLTPDGLNVMQSNRATGWQDVFHFHVHIDVTPV